MGTPPPRIRSGGGEHDNADKEVVVLVSTTSRQSERRHACHCRRYIASIGVSPSDGIAMYKGGSVDSATTQEKASIPSLATMSRMIQRTVTINPERRRRIEPAFDHHDTSVYLRLVASPCQHLTAACAVQLPDLKMHSLARFVASSMFGIVLAILVIAGPHAADPVASSDSSSAVEPSRYRGLYVPPTGLDGESDPFAPGPDSPYWIRLEMTDPEGRKTFHPRLVEVAAQLRFTQRNRAIGLDLQIDLDMHPQPFMTVNEKIYPVEVDFNGWRLIARVAADVGSRQFEDAWFAAFAQQTALVTGLASSMAAPGFAVEFRVEDVEFGPLQKTVVHDDGRITSHAGYGGWLTLRETIGSFVSRQWGLAVQQSFLLAYGALIAAALGLVGSAIALICSWLRARRNRRAVAPRSSTADRAKQRSRRVRSRGKGRR